jgi:uncharacterized protein (TIGR02646 family)
MIKVDRGDAPAGFANRADTWRLRFANERRQKADISASAVWSKVRGNINADAQILAERFHHKCAYCESRPGHVSHPHIEHYRPKGIARFEDKMFDWNNWLSSCGICNEEKWKHFPETNGKPMLLNPAEEDPSSHLCFVGSVLRGLTKRGKKTVELVELDRQPLRNERASWLRVIQILLLLWSEGKDIEVRRECREHLIWTLQEDAPFTGMTRAYLCEKCPKLVNPDAPHPRQVEGDHSERIKNLVEKYTAKLMDLA